ncbi:MAG: hypothetical protein Q7J73_05830 [Dehalococcoidales bacterium]|nr:hypothetical protein [Dehalococcoidales bacterium]
MTDKNTSHLAGEFLVAGELARRGYPVSITMGNAKAIDIHADVKGQKDTIRIQVKATRSKTSWPIRNDDIEDDLYYVFVYLQTENKIKENTPPEYFIVHGKELNSRNLVRPWKNMPGITYRSLEDYRERWDGLPPP